MTTNYSPNSSKERRALVSLQSNFSPFGNKLIQAGYVDRHQMQQAQSESRKSGKPLTSILEGITGKQLPAELQRQYKKQQLFELKVLHGIEVVDPELDQISAEQVANLIDTLISVDMCRRHRLLPLAQLETTPPSLLVAMVDPDNLTALDDLNQILRPQKLALQKRVIAEEDCQQLLDQYLEAKAQKEKEDEEARAQKEQEAAAREAAQNLILDPNALDDVEIGEAAGGDDDGMNLDYALAEAESAPIVRTVNQILARALTDGVSDIHIEPQEEFLRIRMRKDGVLQEYLRLPKKIVNPLVSRFKILADLDIAERRNAQDGRIRRIFQGRTVDFRVNCLPSRYGEKICMRILDNSSTQLGLDKLITDQDALANVREMASRPFGLILVTGPTGSGKSTSLYSVLAERNDPAVNISTAEDPIEYALPGITQCQVIRAKGLDFSALLRAFMRQDPDVILVGETRDKETAKTAIEAALTGHLVLTTLHTNDAAGAIARLDEMGIEPFMVAGALIGVLAQRLMRRVCSECRTPYTPTPEDLGRYGLSASRELGSGVTFYKAGTVPPGERAARKEAGSLCPKCNGGGYKGRVGVYEVLRNTERLQIMISQGAPTEQIREAAIEEGMVTLLGYSLNLVRQGYTTFEEVDRVTFTDSGIEAELKAKRKVGLTCKVCSAGLLQEWLDCPYCMTPRFQD
jgi:type IV pilus assembly protein PilB